MQQAGDQVNPAPDTTGAGTDLFISMFSRPNIASSSACVDEDAFRGGHAYFRRTSGFPRREGGVQGNILGYDSNDFLDFIQVGADIQSIDLNTSFCSLNNPQRMEIVVVLPAPFGPSKPKSPL